MLAINWAEFRATGWRSTRWFHGLLAGNIGQLGAPASGWAALRPAISAIATHVSGSRRRRIRGDDRTPAQRRALARRMSGDDEDAARGHPELRLMHLADVVAVHLERQRALIGRGDAQRSDCAERKHLAVARNPGPFRQRPPDDRRDVGRAGAPEDDAGEIFAVERRALADVDRPVAQVGVGGGVLDDLGHASDHLAVELDLDAGWAKQIAPVERPDPRPGVIPLPP